MSARSSVATSLLALVLAQGCASVEFQGDWAGEPRLPRPENFPYTSPTATPTPAATPFSVDYGNGQLGDGLILDDVTVNNTCHPLIATSGAQVQLGGSSGMVAGRRVLLVQMTDVFATSGDPNGAGDPGTAGTWDLARIQSVSGTTLTLDAPLQRIYVTDVQRSAQACTVPEYASVEIDGGVIVTSPAWNGLTGGVVAILVDGELRLDGVIDANGRGFRGGTPGPGGGGVGVTAEDTSSADGGGKGEGLDATSFGLHGRGNYANGAGGGNARNAGGGGGGNGGSGGLGGFEEGATPNLETSGRGGSSLALSATDRLAPGGGGGAGHPDEAVAGAGGNGGGIVLVFARTVVGTGRIEANGLAGANSSPVSFDSDGAGGGGAGGTILIAADSVSFSGRFEALGGIGGSNNGSPATGPGGGGGGGRVMTVGPFTGVEVRLEGGAAGVAPGNMPRGATPGAPGTREF